MKIIFKVGNCVQNQPFLYSFLVFLNHFNVEKSLDDRYQYNSCLLKGGGVKGFQNKNSLEHTVKELICFTRLHSEATIFQQFDFSKDNRVTALRMHAKKQFLQTPFILFERKQFLELERIFSAIQSSI